jgi:hypothetical protein
MRKMTCHSVLKPVLRCDRDGVEEEGEEEVKGEEEEARGLAVGRFMMLKGERQSAGG